MSKTQTARIEKRLVVPVNEREVRFVPLPAGPNTYDNDVRQIIQEKSELPTGEELAFLLDEVYNSQAPEFKDSPEVQFIRNQVLRNGWLWVPNVNIWTPKSVRDPRLYVLHDARGLGRGQVIDVSQLEDQLSGGSTERGVRFSKDRKVASAPLNTITAGYLDKGKLCQDGAFIANYGVEGAERLDEVAKQFMLNPYSWIVNNTTNDQIQTLSALNWYWDEDSGLDAGFYSNGSCRDGYVFGKTGSK